MPQQPGYHIGVDLSSMPIENMGLLFIFIIALIIIVPIIVIIVVKQLNIKNLGPIKMMDRRSRIIEYHMNEENRALDDACKKEMRRITSNMRTNLNNIFTEENICSLSRVGIAAALRYPLYESVANNHFTIELTEHYESYRERIIELMKDEYTALSSVSKDKACDGEHLKIWELLSTEIVNSIDVWLKRISREVMMTCEKKIIVYKQKLVEFEDAKDEQYANIVKELITKNEHYRTILKTLIIRTA